MPGPVDIVCLSTQDWDGLWTRKQRFMNAFAERGFRVLYIETPVHWLGFDVLPSDPLRPVRFLKGPRKVGTNLHVATLPLLLPAFQMSHAVNHVNQFLVRRMLRWWLGRLGFDNPILWIYTPFSAPLVGKLPHRAAVYECVDEFRGAKGFVRSSVIGSMEDDLLHQVDLTIVTQESLLARRTAICENTHCVPNAADVEGFRRTIRELGSEPPELAGIPHPRLGFVGHIHYWVDLHLIRYLAEHRPSWQFVLVGPVAQMANVRQVKGVRNVHFLGRQARERVPEFLHSMDLCLNPYVRDAIAEHCSPLKLYEYLAAGKPVVSTDMPEARKFPDSVHVASDYEGFLAACEHVLAALPESEGCVRARMESMRGHSWESRFQDVHALLQNLLLRREREGVTSRSLSASEYGAAPQRD